MYYKICVDRLVERLKHQSERTSDEIKTSLNDLLESLSPNATCGKVSIEERHIRTLIPLVTEVMFKYLGGVMSRHESL